MAAGGGGEGDADAGANGDGDAGGGGEGEGGPAAQHRVVLVCDVWHPDAGWLCPPEERT